MEQIKHTVDNISLITVLTNIFAQLPTMLAVVSTLLTIVWYVIRIWEYIKGKKVSSES